MLSKTLLHSYCSFCFQAKRYRLCCFYITPAPHEKSTLSSSPTPLPCANAAYSDSLITQQLDNHIGENMNIHLDEERVRGPNPHIGYFPSVSDPEFKEYPNAVSIEACERNFKGIMRQFRTAVIAYRKATL